MNSPWQIELFGGLRITRDGQVITRFQTRKTAALLAYLAYFRGKVVAREVLADLFWPDNDPEAGRNSLRVALNSLRRQLEPPGVPQGAVLIADRASVQLNTAAFTTDVLAFEEALRQEKLAADDAARTAALLRAVEVYRGSLLAGWYEEWIDLEQTRLTEAYGGILRRLTTLLMRAGSFDQALEYAQRAVHADPLREEAHRLLMRLYAALGRPNAARDQYLKLEQILRHEMGVSPAAVTRELLKQVTSGDAPAIVRVDDLGDIPAALQVTAAADSATPGADGDADPAGAATTARPGGDTAGASPNGIVPLQFTRFFGRDEEIAEVETLLGVGAPVGRGDGVSRFVTLTGPGGTGKTRLGIEIATRFRERYDGSAWVAILSDLTETTQIGPALLTALRLTALPDVAPLERIVDFLQDTSQPLLVLDNLEQMTEAGAEWALLLLERLPALRLLVTSRQRLGLADEREVTLSPLPIPEIPQPAADEQNRESAIGGVTGLSPSLTLVPPETLSSLVVCPSVALFLDRARAVRPDFQITPRNATSIAELCRRLDGLPLAVELAAAWVRLLSPSQMLERLTERYDLLTSDRRENVSPRQRSLRAVMEESWRLMPEDLRPFFAALSIFRGGWNLEAAQTICCGAKRSDMIATDALEMTDLLQQRSLVTARPDPVGEGVRFHMLEMVRFFADSVLTGDRRQELTKAHLAYFADVCDEAGPALTGPSAEAWRERLEVDHDNIRAAQNAALTTEPETALRMASSLWRFWYARGHIEEGYRLLEHALKAAPDAPSALIAAARHGAGRLALSLGNAGLAGSRLDEAALILTREDAPLHMRVMVATDQALAARARGDRSGETDAYEALMALYRQMGDHWAESAARRSLVAALEASGDNEAALRHRGGRDDRPDDSAEQTIFGALLDLGDVAIAQGDYAAGLPLLREALEGFRRDNDEISAARALERIAVAAYRQGSWTLARSAAEEALLLREGVRESGVSAADESAVFLRGILADSRNKEQEALFGG